MAKSKIKKYGKGGGYNDEYSAKEAKRRDEALTRSLQGYAGTEYIKKQMGSSPAKSSSSKKSLPGFTSSAAASTYVKKPIVPPLKKGGSVSKKKK
jgi:hypothetical protein